VFTRSGLPRQLVARVQSNDRLRAPLVPLGGGLWLVPRLDVSPLSGGAPCLHGAIFFKPLLPLGGRVFRSSGMGHMVFRRTFVRLLFAAAPRFGYHAPTVADIVALYNDLSPRFTHAPARVCAAHAALITEYADAGFVLGATFHNSSSSATALFLTLLRGMPPVLGISEVREDLLGLLLLAPDVSDFTDEHHVQTSRAFCSRVLESARTLQYSCQRMRFLRVCAELSPTLGTPPPELSVFPLTHQVVLDTVMAPTSAYRGPDSLDSPRLLEMRALDTLGTPPPKWVAGAHAAAMAARYRRLLADAHQEYPLDDCKLARFHDWFDCDGCIHQGR